MNFTGKFPRTIDAKGRLIVPSRLRDELEDEEVFLTVWMEECISLWSGAGWRRLRDKLLDQRQSSTDARRFVRMMTSEGHKDSVDKQGRITVPQSLREFAGIDSEAVMAGNLDHIEIWSPQRLAEEELRQRSRPLAEQIQELNI